MRYRRQNFQALLITCLLIISACSSAPEKAPAYDSLNSPAKQLDYGIYHYNNNNYPTALEHFDKALLQYRSIDNRSGIANSCMNLAKTYMAINNNEIAARYLVIANNVIKQEALTELNGHMHLLNSSLAINNKLFAQSVTELDTVLNSKNVTVQLAALKNRTTIAFLRNDEDKQIWLIKYRALQQKHAAGATSHHARILRFEAADTQDHKTKTELLNRSINISRELADRTAIAANLSQWSAAEIEAGNFELAEDKSLRALFIRHQLGDVKSSLIVLNQLATIYKNTNSEKYALTEIWINTLSNHQLSDWNLLFSQFENYPQP